MEDVMFDPELFIDNFFKKKKFNVGLQALNPTKYILHVSDKLNKPRFKVQAILYATDLMNKSQLTGALEKLQAEIDRHIKSNTA